ncbi:MAG: SDR family NAD(P)-dependent oxidoreductase [Meiothermus sp.]|nr:SDR family NAD(P)-dependent oxidoreductase [Meiothermus sp.]
MSWLSRLLLSPPALRGLEPLRDRVGGKTVLVTGASYGIGEATALLLAQAGAEVILVARTAEKLERLVGQIHAEGGQATAYVADLYQVGDVPTLARTLEANHPRIDIVVSNAGKSIRRSVLYAHERDDLGRCLALNFHSPAALLTGLLPRMIRQGGGHIINVSSAAARLPAAPRWAAYQSSKAGFEVWLRGVANELRPKNIRASSVYLPLVRTRMIAPTRAYDRAPALTPLEAAQTIAYAIARPRDRLAPWWLGSAELLSLLFTGPVERWMAWREVEGNRVGAGGKSDEP